MPSICTTRGAPSPGDAPSFTGLRSSEYSWPERLEALRAPRKTLVWFERSAHFVNSEEADAFNRFLVERLLPETSRAEPLARPAPASRVAAPVGST